MRGKFGGGQKNTGNLISLAEKQINTVSQELFQKSATLVTEKFYIVEVR